MATKVITVYFNNTKIQQQGIVNTVNNIGYFLTSTSRGADEKEKIISEKDIKIPSLHLSQEYPSSQGYQYTQSIDLSNQKPAVMSLREDTQPMWFGIANTGLFNISNPILFLKFDGTFDIRVKPNESLDWTMMDPNREFNIKLNADLQPGSGFKLYPLFVKFPKTGEYRGTYTITSDNNLPVTGSFIINVANN